MAFDPHYASVSLLLHCDGADGSTTFIDSSPIPKTVSAHGDAAIAAGQGVFGGSCLSLRGEGRLEVLPDDGYAFGTGDFTVEMWLKTTSTARQQCLIGQSIGVIPDGSAGDLWEMNLVGLDPVVAFATYNPLYPDYAATLVEGGGFPNNGQWHHVAVTQAAGLMRCFIDGQLAATYFVVDDYNYDTPQGLVIGAQTYGEPVPGWDFSGQIDELRITKGIARYTSSFAVPTEPFGDGNTLEAVTANASAPSALGEAYVLARIRAAVDPLAITQAPSPLGRTKAICHHDFVSLLGDTVSVYVMDLVTLTGTVRVPISSWQATLQTGSSSYVQCVIPACGVWQEAINAATEFVIYRRAVLPSGAAVEYEMARAPAGQLQFDRGPQRNTCTVSGYSEAFADSVDPPAAYDRALTGVRSISSGSSYRVRCAVDWLLRPGHRAYVSGAPFIVKFINYYAPSSFDSYMDVGG